MKRLLFLIPLVLAAIALAAATEASAQSSVVLTFTKRAVSDNLYLGTIDGGGVIEVMVLDRRSTDSGQRLSALFRVNVGDRWFATVLKGSLDSTGQTHLEGAVTYGNWLQGAKVREEGQLIRKNPFTFTGSLSLTAKRDGDAKRPTSVSGVQTTQSDAVERWLRTHASGASATAGGALDAIDRWLRSHRK